MELKISQRMAAMQPSAIREIFKNMADPSIVPFAGGNPSPDAFPVKQLENIARIVFENKAVTALQYSVTEGYPQLREAAKQFANSRGSPTPGTESSSPPEPSRPSIWRPSALQTKGIPSFVRIPPSSGP